MHNISLKYWVLLLTIVPTTIIGFGLAGYFSYSRSSELDEFINLRAQSIIEPLAITGKKPFVDINREELRLIISATHRSQSGIVKSIAVFTLNNKTFITSAYQADTNLMRLKVGQKIPTYTQSEYIDDFIIFRSPILDERIQNAIPVTLGYIALQIDKSRIKSKQQSQYIIAFTTAFLASLLSAVFALKLIRHIAKPINSMVQAIDRIREGKLESRVSEQLVGELNLLKNGINAMAQSLGNYQNELQNSIDQATVVLRESLEQFEIQNVELSTAKKKALEVSKIKSEFLANMSHELRTPLNGVIGFTRQVLKTPLSDSQRDYLQIIDRSANNLLTIINDILDFSKLDACKMVIENIPFSLREAIEDTLVLLAPSAHKKNIELSFKMSNALPDSLLGDAMRIKQIMSNLISNAIKFTQYGSVMIDVTLKFVSTKLAVIKITVVDTGIGMNNEQQKSIFKAFSQADQSITRLHGGTGLGLVICQRLAYEMKGNIGFSSQENNGSTFWFQFECGVNTLSLNNELDMQHLANKTILYYEPHLHSRAATYDILLNWGMQVTPVESISQLTKALKNSKQTKTVFDYALIGHDRNATALSDLKKIITQIKPQITNIHLAINSNSPSLHDALLASGALSCLSKPINTNKLYTALLADQENLFPTSRRILPIKVLAVDDNEANLKLINALLLEQVSDVVIADNGMKAFELCKDEKFDLIFMDIQMPIMDGISTLKAIKRDTSNSKTPIIAVTAHALSGEKEKMQQQGFNAYMTKPIDETMLNHIIYEYCDVNHFINSNDQHLLTATKTTYQPQTITNKASVVIDWSLALHRTGGKENLAIAMLTGLVDSLAKNHKNISKALISQDTEQLKSLIHKLNGACCYTGVPNLTTICQEIETQLKSGNTLDNLEPEFLEFFEQLEQVATAAPKLLAELEKKNTPF